MLLWDYLKSDRDDEKLLETFLQYVLRSMGKMDSPAHLSPLASGQSRYGLKRVLYRLTEDWTDL